MNLLVSNHLILVGLRSFCVISRIRPCILFHESMALTVTENFQNHLSWKIFFMEMAFYRESCAIVVNTIAELKPVFKDKRKHVIQCFTNEKNIIYHSLVTKLENIIFLKKRLEWEFRGWNDIILMAFFIRLA